MADQHSNNNVQIIIYRIWIQWFLVKIYNPVDLKSNCQSDFNHEANLHSFCICNICFWGNIIGFFIANKSYNIQKCGGDRRQTVITPLAPLQGLFSLLQTFPQGGSLTHTDELSRVQCQIRFLKSQKKKQNVLIWISVILTPFHVLLPEVQTTMWDLHLLSK